MADQPVARSPIAAIPPVTVRDGWEVTARQSTADLTLTDCTPLAKVAVNARQPTLSDVPFGRSARSGSTLVIGSGPGEWLLLGPPGTAQQLAGASPAGATKVDLTHGRALVRLTGPRAATLLGRLTTIDLADDFTPDRTALRTQVAALATDIVRDDQDGQRSYLLHVERSSGQYLFDTLLAAGADLGIDISGFTGT